MPRYFFHFSDGKRQFTDTSGHELSGMAAARAYATEHARELKAAICEPHIQDMSGWTMTVVDGDGKNIFELNFNFKSPRPGG